MNRARFDEVWRPRIGEDATEQLWRGRRGVIWYLLILVFAITSSFLWGTGPVGDTLGGVLVMGCVCCVSMMMRDRRRTSAAISDWLGIKRLKAIPTVTPQRFDQWRATRGYMTPEERLAAEKSAEAANTH